MTALDSRHLVEREEDEWARQRRLNREAAIARGQRRQAGACVCNGSGWIEVGDPDANTVEPCAGCRPTVHDRWQRGVYMPASQ